MPYSLVFTLSVYLLLLATKDCQSNNGAVRFNKTQAVPLGKDVVIHISLGAPVNCTNGNILWFKNGTLFNFYVDNATYVFSLLNVTNDGNYTLCIGKKYKEKVVPFQTVSDRILMFLSTYGVAIVALIVVIVAACLVCSKSKAYKKEIRELKDTNLAQTTTLEYLSKLTVQRNDCDFVSFMNSTKPTIEQESKEPIHQIPSMPSYPPPVPPNKELFRSSSPHDSRRNTAIIDEGPCYEDCVPVDRPPFPLPSEIRHDQPFYDNVAPDPEQSTTRNFMSSIKSLVSRNAKTHQQRPRQNVNLSNRQSPVFRIVTPQQFKSGFDNPTFHSSSQFG